MSDVAVNDLDKAESASVWRYARARRARVLIDADDYFKAVREAMTHAQQRIFLIGWDFDSRILLSGGRRWWHKPHRGKYPARLGSFIVWLVKRTPGLDVKILKWNFGVFSLMKRGSMIWDLARWAKHQSIKFKFDTAHPIGCSHHQKIVVIDDCVAVCGGIDMTSDRWDTRDHVDEDERRRLPSGELYTPWHDLTMMMEGEIAGDLAELGRARWMQAGGEDLGECEPQDESPWPEELDADFEDVEIGIARTRAQYDGVCAIREIEALFVEQIARARRFVYAETQYFASRKIAEAITKRLEEPEPPEFVILNPRHADGWLEQTAMDTARIRLMRSMRQHDHAGRFHLYHPYTAEGTPIYVHAKLTIIDDEIIRIGSANMNNRSLGLDSECDVFIDADRPANKGIGPTITRIRHSLLAEHCNISVEEVAAGIEEHGSMAAMIDSLPKEGKRLRPFHDEDLSDIERALADNEILDPESPDEFLEPISKRGLFRRGGLSRPRRAWRRIKRKVGKGKG
ncbi:phospholipase D/transphosphatidylase [Novosphingobium marinum]|nr:phospholipase D-like domain-containing protein [Novosphingobium marinum]GGC23294.1 phospholipase D/transphosphatidylase [Novosphingobium marinum]